MSFVAKLKRGLAEATLTTEQRRDTNIYTEKPDTHTDTRTGILSCLTEMVTFTQTSLIYISRRRYEVVYIYKTGRERC